MEELWKRINEAILRHNAPFFTLTLACACSVDKSDASVLPAILRQPPGLSERRQSVAKPNALKPSPSGEGGLLLFLEDYFNCFSP
jgi:hypothetical protein